MRELIESESNPVAAYRASAFLLGAGAGVVMPSPPSTSVNIAIGSDVPAGFVIDLSEPPADRGPAPASALLTIDGTAIEPDDDPPSAAA